ncbi:polyphosphate kinase 1 [Euzebya tangerina]|uniref:polyphosphate kinase 1 n=1 Tax=Euzebya tangerina TaxID=591198 RepID=UPI00196B91C6|nr:polyphosphate kinase 1 [Euzebya tangerina]
MDDAHDLDPLRHLPTMPPGTRYGDRELSQLSFNTRVLALAADPEVPLLERVAFCAIFSGNTDEWVQKRLQLVRDDASRGNDASSWLAGTNLLATVHGILADTAKAQSRIWREQLVPALADEGIHVVDHDALDDDQRAQCSRAFERRMFPILTPLAIDPGRPFPHISSLSLNLAVRVRTARDEESFARIKVPRTLGRFVELSGPDDTVTLVPTEQVVAAHLHVMFPAITVIEHGVFRVTRFAHQFFEEEQAEDLLDAIETGLLERRFDRVVRVEAQEGMPDGLLGRFVEEFDVEEGAIITVPGPLDLEGAWQIAGQDRPGLHYPQWSPRVPAALGQTEDIWAAIRAGDVMVHHPYDDFERSTQAFIQRAASDPKVMAIKLTIYRTTGRNSPIVESLIRAAEAGKQTVALVELKARFDEEANIRRAKALEAAGVHVVYGLIGLKTHTKTCLVIREEDGELRRYAHVGTGNYNPSTAGIYEDLGLFTADQRVGEDLSHLFNMLTGYSDAQPYSRLLVAPDAMRGELMRLIGRETERGAAGHITIKCNNLVDRQVVDALYDASDAGTRVELYVRSMCAVVPGVEGLSENITVRSVVGRFLEHSRIFRFGPPRSDDVVHLIGSADMMARNLDSRVEAIIPVLDQANRAQLDDVFAIMAADTWSAWDLRPDGSWHRSGTNPETGTHTVLQQRAKEREAVPDPV